MLQQKSAITKAEDLILIHDVNISKPINIKKEMQDYVALQDLEYKMLKWEALRLVGKANECAFKTELRYRKEFKKLPYEYGVAIGFSMINDDLKLVEDAFNEAMLMMRKNKSAFEDNDDK